MKINDKYILEEFVKTSDRKFIYAAYPIYKKLYYGNSEFQEIVIAETPFGKTLFLDDALQLTEYDEEIYHKALVLPGIKKSYRDILILGGGDGGAAREVKKFNPNARVKIVDIDRMVTEVIKKYMPEVPQGVFEMDGVELINDDAFHYVEVDNSKYDYIISDLTDIREEWERGSQVNRLYTSEFLNTLKSRLREDGKIVYHIDLYPNFKHMINKFLAEACKVFKYITVYGVYIPSFCGIWTYALLSNRPFRIKHIKTPYQDKLYIITERSYRI